ncbi:hypothetical protein [Nitratiruptor sp. SB155-2]|nr:hypothetical protein [Nitratiruptor sp. SB155-2]
MNENKEKNKELLKEIKREILKMEKENLYIHKSGLKEKIIRLIKARTK